MADMSKGEQTSQQPQANKNNTKRLLIGAIVVIVVVLGLFMAFGRDADREEGAVGSEESQETIREELELVPEDNLAVPEIVPGEVKEIAVSTTNFKFTPSEIRVRPGDTVRVTLTNNGNIPHDFRVDEFNAATEVIQGGQTDTVEFVASEAGMFEYYCSVGNHRQIGMVGKLIVE